MANNKKAPSNAALERAREIIFDTLDEDYDTAYVNGPPRVARALDEWAARARTDALREVAKLLDENGWSHGEFAKASNIPNDLAERLG